MCLLHLSLLLEVTGLNGAIDKALIDCYTAFISTEVFTARICVHDITIELLSLGEGGVKVD